MQNLLSRLSVHLYSQKSFARDWESRIIRSVCVEPLESRAYLSATFQPIPSGPGVVVADFNNDGRPDTASIGSVPLGFRTAEVPIVNLNNGDGTFTPVSDTPTDNSVYHTGSTAVLAGLVGGDFNGDGNADLAFLETDGGSTDVIIAFGAGNGHFSGGTSFSVGDAGSGAHPPTLAAGDFNDDGRLDLVMTDAKNNLVLVLLNDGNPANLYRSAFINVVDPIQVVAADFNGDGVADVAYISGSASGTVFVAINRYDATFAPPTAFAFGSPIESLAAGDIRGTGMPDIVATTSTAVNLLLNQDGGFVEDQLAGVTSDPQSVTIGDFNGDGITDIRDANQYFLGLGSRNFDDGQASASPVATSDLTPTRAASATPKLADAGGKTKISQTLRIQNTSDAAITGTTHVSLVLSPDGAYDVSDPVIASTDIKGTLKAGRSRSVHLHANRIPASVVPGQYYVMAVLTDPTGAHSVISSPGLLTVRTDFLHVLSFTGSLKKASSTLNAGKPLSIEITVTNTGNVPINGNLPIVINDAHGNADGSDLILLSTTRHIHIQPGKSKTLRLSHMITPAKSSYQLGCPTIICTLDPLNTLMQTTNFRDFFEV